MPTKHPLSRILLMLTCCLLTANGYAQLQVGCKPTSSIYLQYEPIHIAIEITNLSSRDIVVGGPQADAYLICEIHNLRGPYVERNKENDIQPFVIPARGTIKTKVNILPYYDLRELGSYLLKLRIDWKTKSFYSKRNYFDIVSGIQIESILVESNSNTFRTFTIEVVRRDKKELAFLRIEDKYTCYAVLELGEMINLYPPQMIADADGQVHILLHSRPTEYKSFVVSQDGIISERGNYAVEQGKPTLEANRSGGVVISQQFTEE